MEKVLVSVRSTIEEVLSEMDSINVNLSPVKPTTLQRWVDNLRLVRDVVSQTISDLEGKVVLIREKRIDDGRS